MSPIRHLLVGGPLKLALAVTVTLVLAAQPAFGEPILGAAAPEGNALIGMSAALLVGVTACLGLASFVVLMRILLPGAARAGDAALHRVGTKGLLLGGVLPLLGAGLIAQGVGQTGSQGLGLAFALLIALPLCLAILLGVLSVVPHIGQRALGSDDSIRPLVAAVVGALVVGFSMAGWAIPPLGLLVSLLVAGWFLATGLGAFVHRSPAPPPLGNGEGGDSKPRDGEAGDPAQAPVG